MNLTKPGASVLASVNAKVDLVAIRPHRRTQQLATSKIKAPQDDLLLLQRKSGAGTGSEVEEERIRRVEMNLDIARREDNATTVEPDVNATTSAIIPGDSNATTSALVSGDSNNVTTSAPQPESENATTVGVVSSTEEESGNVTTAAATTEDEQGNLTTAPPFEQDSTSNMQGLTSDMQASTESVVVSTESEVVASTESEVVTSSQHAVVVASTGEVVSSTGEEQKQDTTPSNSISSIAASTEQVEQQVVSSTESNGNGNGEQQTTENNGNGNGQQGEQQTTAIPSENTTTSRPNATSPPSTYHISSVRVS